jgi:hypothetical protein
MTSEWINTTVRINGAMDRVIIEITAHFKQREKKV